MLSRPLPLLLPVIFISGSASAQSLAGLDLPALADLRPEFACSESSDLEENACHLSAAADWLNALGDCLNRADPDEAGGCAEEAAEARAEKAAGCAAQADARLALCARLGEAPYDPVLDPAAFVDPHAIGDTVEPNRYLPLVAGNRWAYRGSFVDEDGETVTEEFVVTVTGNLKLVDGIMAVVVNDVVTRNGVVHEDTNDWFAQDRDGNVWYLGEEVRNYELFAGDEPTLPELVDTDGAWRAGEDGARAGIAMPADPTEGRVYRQEFGVGGPQDVAEVVDLAATDAVPAARCEATCLVTREWTPAEPGSEGLKIYAPGIGLILEVEGDTRIELISFESGG